MQVTATNDVAKIKEAIRRFLDHDLDKQYEILSIFLLAEKKQYQASFATEGRFTFDRTPDGCYFRFRPRSSGETARLRRQASPSRGELPAE